MIRRIELRKIFGLTLKFIGKFKGFGFRIIVEGFFFRDWKGRPLS
jgi:hypothetical protein